MVAFTSTSSVESTIAVVGSAAAVAASNTDKIVKVAAGLGLLDAGELAGGGVIRKLAKDQVEEFVGVPSKKKSKSDGKRHQTNDEKGSKLVTEKQIYSAAGIPKTYTRVSINNGSFSIEVKESSYLFMFNESESGRYKQSVLNSMVDTRNPGKVSFVAPRFNGIDMFAINKKLPKEVRLPKATLMTRTSANLHHQDQKVNSIQRYVLMPGAFHLKSDGSHIYNALHTATAGIGESARKLHASRLQKTWKRLYCIRGGKKEYCKKS